MSFPVFWNAFGESQINDSELVQETSDRITLICQNSLAAYSRQKSYADKRRKPLKFLVMGFSLSSIEIVERVGNVAYRLNLPNKLSNVHPKFHVSNLRKCLAEGNLHILLDEVQMDESMRAIEKHAEIVGHMDKETKRTRIPHVKVRWESKRGPEFTWEREDQMMTKFPNPFVAA
ncbi:uncharacterized protein LOC143594446 [Bidens hawaiensis]|uniref:uncharacterized protein LOC143594446 n=1 Tax=Bidens hawaiensis TaxID=980011 RepID=UPI0040496A2A